MADCEVIIQTTDGTAIGNAWVYWGKNGTLLRSDPGGHLYSLTFAANRPRWDYTSVTSFRAAINSEVEIYYSRGAKPIPEARLKEHADVFYKRKLEVKPADSAPRKQAKVGTGDHDQSAKNTLAALPQVILQLPDILIGLTMPQELSLWPVFWELPTNDYMVNGLPQAAALWTANRANLTVQDLQPSPAPAAAVQPRERGLHVVGTIDATATGVRLQILDVNGNVVQLRQNIATSSNQVQFVNGTLTPYATGKTKAFEVDIFYGAAVNTFGPVQIFLLSEGKNPPIIEAFAVQLVGVQIALVDDYGANPNGQQRGQQLGQVDEITVVDFLNSPQAQNPAGTNVSLLPQTRGRRMNFYRFQSANRPLRPPNPANPNAPNPNVPTPQMPMWMAECQILGITLEQLTDLMKLRLARSMKAVASLKLDLQWQLTLSWNGPDSHNVAGAVYSYLAQFDHSQTAELHYSYANAFTDSGNNAVRVGAQGEFPGAFAAAPTVIPFPIANRRLPQVVVSQQQRAWGRQAGATQAASMLIEFQPAIEDNGDEIIRGGNGKLELRTLTIDGQDPDPGRIPDPAAAGTLKAAAADPIVQLPEFRIRGVNPTRADVESAIDAIADEIVNGRQRFAPWQFPANAQDTMAFLPLAAWQQTARLVFHKESSDGGDHYSQFLARTTRTSRYGTDVYGYSQDMPLHGPPHGYALVQRDPPDNTYAAQGCTGDEVVWDFLTAVRCGLLELMAKGGAALHAFRIGPGAAAFNALGQREQRAMVQRELIRRYNGGREFQFQGVNWVIQNNINDYPNQVLHPSGAVDVQYPGPVQLQPANFGPGI